MRILAAALALLTGTAAAARKTSVRPALRGEVSGSQIDVALKRPVSRPGTNARNISTPAPTLEHALTTAARPRAHALRPRLRPHALQHIAMARREVRRKGQVCGDPDLQGDAVGYVPGQINGCGIKEAVRLRSVSGITVSQPSLMNCATAKALKKWTEKGAKRALSDTGGGLAHLRVAAHYACRTRNSQRGARISEHGKGRAIDISGFTLRDGTQLTVLNDWNSRHGDALKSMHRAACGPFGTVLGPNSDRFHRDHFHFDTARHRDGAFCR